MFCIGTVVILSFSLYFTKQQNFGLEMKAFADVKLNVAKKIISLFDRVENIAGKGENAGYQHFLLFPQCFPKPSFWGVV